MRSVSVFRIVFAVAILSCLAVSGCKKAAASPQGVALPPTKVTVAHPLVRDCTQWDEYTGHLQAVDNVEVRAQVSGFVDSVNFTEGSIVKAGDVLLTIDSRVFKAQLDAAQAQLLQAQAKLAQAQATVHLGQDDLKRALDVQQHGGGITPEEVETRRATVEQDQADVSAAQAQIASAQAAIKTAQLNIEWCTVKAPITGEISDKLITLGNMLTGGPGQTTKITTITSVDPIYCYFDADEASVLKYQKMGLENKAVPGSDQLVDCWMGLDKEAGFPRKGRIDFVDNQLDPKAGTLRIRAVFANADHLMKPGMFAHVRVAGETLHDAAMVIDDCIGTDQDRKFVYVLHPDNTIEQRTVVTGILVGELRVIRSGLRPDELVLINGIANVRPGAKVDPVTTPMPENRFPAATAPAGSAPAQPSTAPAPASPQAAGATQPAPAATEAR